ncbi:chromatin modification-related protein EAF1 B-like isoform X2 [Oryza brachyantha]|uniref:Myb-like domain-containing protein n=1 Tax=Oryza brachyantha TaxID=4533 RepID=J3MAC6_ORYBR|nr:chromatin modification-related protein EAF1 B-like isoform X2 [Oryza brachyantha]
MVKPHSMGGIINYGVSISNKSSPRSLAIEKAQEELRQEHDVREERKRELEFLEKGGNPLDFKFVHVASVSVQSTSLTDQIAEQNTISDAKGSFAFAASPPGDSVESNGKPGSSPCRETNTADNLMLFLGNNSDVVEEKIVKRGTKRTIAAQSKQPLPTDGHNNAKQAEDSVLSRLGVKSQAYVRRNRTKPCREIASIKSPVVPAKSSEPKGVIQGKQADGHGSCSVSVLKLAGQKHENAIKSTSSDEQVAMELDGIQTVCGSHHLVKNEATQGDDSSKAVELLPNVNGNQQLGECGEGEVVAAGESVGTPDSTSNIILRTSYSSTKPTHHARETRAYDEKVEDGQSDKGMTSIHVGEPDDSGIGPVCAVESGTLCTNIVDLHCEETINITNNLADGKINQGDMKIVGKPQEDLATSRISNKGVRESGQLEGFSRSTSVKENSNCVQPEVSTIAHVKDELEACDSAVVAQKDIVRPSPGHSMDNEESPGSERRNSCLGNCNPVHPIVAGPVLPKIHPIVAGPVLPKISLPEKSNIESEIQKSGENLDKMAQKEYEDSILKKARLIEVSLKRAGEQSDMSLEKSTKGHWDFVLDEMAWMANDFMQERLWKNMAAAQICHWIVSKGRAKFDEAIIQRKQKAVTRGLIKGIMNFWRSAEALQTTGRTTVTQEHNSHMLEKTKHTGVKAEKSQGNESLEKEERNCPHQSRIQDYAVKFIEYNSQTSGSLVLAEAPPTPDRLNDFGTLKVSDLFSEGNLFYTVAPSAMQAYRESVESLFVHHKKAAGLKDDYEASGCDSAADLPQENVYEDEGETCTYLSEAYDGGLLSQMGQKKHLGQQRINGARSYETSTHVPFEPYLERKLSNGKRASSFLAVPTKRVRTAARQRIISPFPAGVGGTTQVTSKTDVSSGDTSSYQDDQSSLYGGSLPWKNSDFESTVDFDRKLPYDGSTVFTKANKKKKLKNPGYKTTQNAANSSALASVKGRIYDQRTQADFFTQYDQKDFLKKKSDPEQFDSKWNIAAHGGQHSLKKLKLMRQGIDISQEASPVASQMSNMANSAKIIKIITNRDRGRKGKALKLASSGGWSNFEDQALVVLVHDLGQNWELVSDAINSIVQFKSVYRQPKGCKERYKVLVDKNSGDGADSAEDSGSSQHYHFTLPGIPKGSARQLFQRLQGPIEEENLKAHFEKMILLMRQMHSSRRRKGNSQELKSIIQPHSSHAAALTQAFPNNLSGGALTPLDLCDAVSSNLDTSTPGSGYDTNGLTPPNHHGSNGPTAPNSTLSSRSTGSPGTVLGNNLSPHSTFSASSRDAHKYGIPRCTSLQSDEQQKIHYNQMLSGRNLQHTGGSVSGTFPPGVDRGARVMPSTHGMGMMTGLNRGMPAATAGFPRHSSPGMPNVVSPGNVSAKSGHAVNVHPGAMSATGNTTIRSHNPMQPGQNMEEHRQTMMPEFHMQVSQGNTQGISSMNQPFSNAASSSPVQSFPIQQHQQTHQISQPSHMFGNPHHLQIQGISHSNSQQQTYAMRLAKERHSQQRMVPEQQNDLPGASAVPSIHNGSQGQLQKQSPAASPAPASQPQRQRQQAAQNPPDSYAIPSQPTNATATQHKSKKSQQQPRQNQQQRNQGSQQAKLMKSLGRGNMVIPQTTVDTTPTNAVSTSSKKQVTENKMIQHGQGTLPGNKTSSPSIPHPVNQHKLYSSALPQSPKQLPDIGIQGVSQGSPSRALLTSQQLPLHSKSPLTTQQQHRHANSLQNSIQTMMMPQNLQMNSGCRTDSQVIQVQHNQIIPTPSIPQSTGSGSTGLPSISQQKHELSNDSVAVNSTSMMLSSSQDALERETLGGFHMYGGQWHQEQSKQLQQSPNQQIPVVQGSVYAPLNPGPG